MKEVIDLLKKYTNGKQNTEKVEINVLLLNRVIKALEQDSILDKIKGEIEQVAFNGVDNEKFIFVRRVNQIIEKYKAERLREESK